MIRNKFLIPECYVYKIPYCDECNIELKDTNTMVPTDPPKWKYICPNCNKEYNFLETELRGEWKWRTI